MATVKTQEPLKIVAIMGPTASGKSEWAIKLAKQFNGIIISADSKQVYKGLDIATTKVSKALREEVPHYMLDVVKPSDEYSTAQFQKAVYRILAKIKKQNLSNKKPVLPILVGGTGLYADAVLKGFDLSIQPNLDARNNLNKKPLASLVAKLLRLDPNTKVDLKNKVRVVRAIEIAESGKPAGVIDPGLRFIKIGLSMPREKLYQRIDRRVSRLPIDKLTAETLRYYAKMSATARVALGYDLVFAYANGRITKDELLAKLAQLHRNYARKQLTWLRRDKDLVWAEDINQAKLLVRKFLTS
jgi:tRNA dimethylallyltransferase